MADHLIYERISRLEERLAKLEHDTETSLGSLDGNILCVRDTANLSMARVVALISYLHARDFVDEKEVFESGDSILKTMQETVAKWLEELKETGVIKGVTNE